jgi:hypothetical protein
MTQLLEQALSEVKKLPEPEQDAIATLILDELADERRWQESFARSQDQLARLAAKVREDVRAGRVKSGLRSAVNSQLTADFLGGSYRHSGPDAPADG